MKTRAYVIVDLTEDDYHRLSIVARTQNKALSDLCAGLLSDSLQAIERTTSQNQEKGRVG